MSHPRATLAASMGGGAYYGNEGGSSIADQLMQLDPAITATLQEIDANFARAHQIVTAQLLPAVKVYGQHSAKTWQSAKFWQDFFITAAHIPVKRPEDEEVHPDSDYNGHDDQSSYDPSSTTEDAQASTSYDRSQGEDSRGSGAQDDDSNDSAQFFQSVKNARASSPPRLSNTSLKAVGRREERDRDARAAAAGSGANESDASWAAMESPFEKLKREVKADQDASMSQAETLLAQHRANKAAREHELLAERRDAGEGDESLDQDRRDLVKGIENMKVGHTARSPAKLRPGGSGSAKLLNKVLNAEQRKADAGQGQRTPGKSGGASAAPSSSRNPFDHRDPRTVGSSKWDGIADLRKTPLGTSGKPRTKSSKSKKQQQKAPAAAGNEWESDEEDSLAWPAGMSPPVTLQFSVPQSKYAKTPAKEAAKLVVDDLLRTVEAGPATVRRERERRAAAAAAREKGGDTASPGVALGGGSASASRPRSVPRASLAGTPLKKGPLGKPPKGQGAQKRRDSMPTPPTLTRHGIAPMGPRQSTTPLAPPASMVPGSAASSTTAGGGRAALLMDEGEDGLEEGLDELPDLHAGSKTDIDALLAEGQRRDGSEESESESDESDEDEDDVVPPASVSKLSTFSTNSGWSSSSNNTGERHNLMASLDNDTLFGVGGGGGGGKPAAAGSAASRGTASSSSTGGRAPGSSFHVVGPQLDQTVQGGQLLADKDVTYSAPSPTPWK